MNVIYLWKSENWMTDTKKKEYYIGNKGIQLYLDSVEDIQSIHGNFAAIWETINEVNLIVDLIGSYPLFYSVCNDDIYVSDDAKIIADRSNNTLKNENVTEFLRTGYVTENETLFTNIYTLNPGTHVRIDKTNGKTVEEKWFELEYTINEASRDNYKKKFEICLNNVFSDLISRANGRTILVPLSGGLDSRLIVACLKKLNYNNVVCFSYGRPGNWESTISKDIASHLHYQWIFEEYNADVWTRIIKSNEYNRFLDWSCRGRSIGCLQALPAILDIRNRELVPEDSIVVPGHTLDVSLGSHLIDEFLDMNNHQLIEYIVKHHYDLSTIAFDDRSIKKWENRLGAVDPINFYMEWEYKNRQSKFIANDVRAYEYTGYTFELPFWDIRIQQFAMSLPIDELMGRKFQLGFTNTVVNPIVGIQNIAIPDNNIYLRHIKRILKRSRLIISFPICRTIYA